MISKLFRALSLMAVLAVPTSTFADADVTVIHGIPGLPEAVDVLVDDEFAFSFDYPEQVATTLPEGTYNLKVQLEGATVLEATATVDDGGNYTAIAHQTYIDGVDSNIKLSLFENDTSELGRKKTRVTARHTADAPAVDLKVQRKRWGCYYTKAFIEDLANNDDDMAEQGGPVDTKKGKYRVKVFATGDKDALVKEKLGKLKRGRSYIVFAVGSLSGGTFDFIVQVIDLRDKH